MSSTIDQKAYLQKYLGGPSEKKKKKKKAVKGNGMRIIDDDIDLSKLRPLDGDEIDILDQSEDAPQIAGIIDERPEELRQAEQFTSSKWKVINKDDGFNSKLQIEEIKRDVKEKEKENELIFGKMYSDSEDEKNDADLSPQRKDNAKSRQKSDSDCSPPRKNQSPKRKYDSDISPPRKESKRYDSDVSPPRKKDRNSTPPRAKDKSKRKPTRWGHFEEPKDSPERKKHKKSKHSDTESKKSKRKDIDRRSRKDSPKRSEKNGRRSSSDLSPPRKSKKYDSDSDLSPPRKDKRHSPPRKKMDKTLDGKMAGLQDAVQLRQENEAFRKREDDAFKNMTDDVSGRNAQVVSRKGKRDTSEDRKKQTEKVERQKELDEKYKKWSKGLKQIESQESHYQDYIHEASKPLARHRDDRNLEDRLKQIDREGDPMLQYIREKKRERGELPPEKPSYKGNFPPNRFNIRPGYRWDGVDRSNGYETKFFDHQSKRKAQEEEAYKWSTEDL